MILFTYKIYFSSIEKTHYLRLISTREFRKRFGVAVDSLYDMSNTILFINEVPLLRVSFHDKLVNNNIAYEVIKFYLSNEFGEFQSITYSNIQKYWTCYFKIIKRELLLELM
jgi:hypothetical protein